MNRKELLQKVARQFIPNLGTILLVLALLWVRDAQASGALTAKSTTTISYQGRLANSSGAPITSAGLGMTFRLYNATTGGSALWTETYPGVPVNDGLFHVLLGSVTPLDASYFSAYDTLYLGIAVGADAEMTPREQLASAPYAIQAGRALTVPDGSITTAKLADGAVTASKQTIKTYSVEDNNYFTTTSILPVIVSNFSLNDVPAGDVTVMCSFVALVPSGIGGGTVSLATPTGESYSLPIHVMSAHYGQYVLNGKFSNFGGGTFNFQIKTSGEATGYEIRFGAPGDPRFGRHCIVIAGI